MTNEEKLIKAMKESNATAYFPSLEDIDLMTIDDTKRYEQGTLDGIEKHRLKTYLAIMLLRVMRDIRDNESSVYSSHDAVDKIITMCKKDKVLRRRLRKQIRRFLKSPMWQYNAQISDTWICKYCGETVLQKEDGFGHRSHLENSHQQALPIETDDGFPFSPSHIAVVRGHILGCLCGLVREKSWDNHRSYFKQELQQGAFADLEKDILKNGNALRFYETYDFDYDLPKGNI